MTSESKRVVRVGQVWPDGDCWTLISGAPQSELAAFVDWSWYRAMETTRAGDALRAAYPRASVPVPPELLDALRAAYPVEAVPVPREKFAATEKAAASSACPKCRAIGPHDRETCFGRWLSTPHNDPPAAFVATVERTGPAPKFKVGEHVVVSGSPKITGDVVAQVIENGARGYCLAYQSAAGREGAIVGVSEAHLRRPRKGETWARYSARELREAGRT